jgi:hypothetical protein
MDDRPAEAVRQLFEEQGFHRVFHQPASFQVVFDALRLDLADVAA